MHAVTPQSVFNFFSLVDKPAISASREHFILSFGYGDCVISTLDPDNLVSRFGIALKRSEGDGFDSVDGFVDAISKVLEDKELWLSKVTSAYKYVNKVHNFEAFRRNVMRLVGELEIC